MTSMRRAGGILRGLVALIGLVMLVVGVPLVLVVVIGNPVPADSSMIRTLSDEALLGVLACVAWVVWAQLAICVLVETVAEIRMATGRSASWLARVPGTFGGQQALARTLVQAVVAIGAGASIVGTANPWILSEAEAADSSPAVVAAAPIANRGATAAEHPERIIAERVSVERGDSLWSIAEQRLGAGERWRDIADLNTGRTMSDGTTFDRVGAIHPGWVLLVPAGAQAHPSRETVVVERGDTLWEIAEERYGHGEDWPRIYHANRDQIDDPDWIYPGQEFRLPGSQTPADDEDPPPTEASLSDQEPESETESSGSVSDPDPDQPVEVTPSPSPDTGPTPIDSADPGIAGEWQLDGATIARALVGGGGLLGAGALSLYLARRRTQGRNRRSGRMAPTVVPELRAEDKAVRQIGALALAPAAFFDAALRELALRAENDTGTLPEVVAARIDDHQLALYLREPSYDAPDPWVAARDGKTWTLARSHEPTETNWLAPYPAMVTLGDDVEGGTVFLDLEGVGVTQVLGDPDAGEDLVRFLAAELALNPWSTVESVSLVGDVQSLVPLNPGRLVGESKLDIDQLAKRVRQVHENASSGRGVLASRVAAGVDPSLPTVTIAAVARSEVVRHEVDGLLDELDKLSGRSPVVLLAWTPELLADRGVALTVDSEAMLTTPWGKLTANRLTQDEAATLMALLDDADREGDEPIPALVSESGDLTAMNAAGALLDSHTEGRCTTGDPHSLLPKPDRNYVETAATTTEDLASLAPAVPASATATRLAADPALDADVAEWELAQSSRPRLRVLGPVELDAVGEQTKEVESRTAYFAELTAYLNCHPSGLTPTQFAMDFGVQNNTLHTRLGQLRKWLSTKPDGGWYLPNAQWSHGQKVYRLDGILADDDLFRRLRARAAARGPLGIEDLRRALNLVRGRPYDRQRAGGYGWLADSPQDHYMTAAVVDVAHLLATHALGEGDPNLAIWAAEKAILAAPAEDRPRLDLAQAMRLLGRSDEADAYLDSQVFNRTDDDRPPLDPSDRTMQVARRTDRP